MKLVYVSHAVRTRTLTVGHNITAGADWVTSSAVRAEHRCVAVEACEILWLASVGLLVGTVEHVVGLVGSMHHVSPEKSCRDLCMSAWVKLRHRRICLPALPAAELLSRPVETKVQPPYIETLSQYVSPCD